MRTVETQDQQPVDRRVADREAAILYLPEQSPPSELEGFSDLETVALEQANQRNYVARTKVIDSDTTRHGKVQTEIFTMDNGRKYEVVTGTPYKQQVDTPIVKTTALATSIRGHNMHNMLMGMKLGYPVVMVGPEGGHAHLPKTPKGWYRLVRNLMSITLEETAENIHEILDVTDTYGLYQPGQFVSTGESRGTMAGMGVVSRASKFGRMAIYADFTAGCFPKPRADIKNHENLALETVRQVNLFSELPLKMSPRRYIHYPATLNLNPYFMAHVIGTIPTLLNGSAGQLAREIPTTANMHHTVFTEDSWSCPDAWEEIFADHPGVVHTRRPGNHMAITNELTARERTVRLEGLRDQLITTNHDPARINWYKVHMAGRLAARGA